MRSFSRPESSAQEPNPNPDPERYPTPENGRLDVAFVTKCVQSAQEALEMWPQARS